MRPAATLLLATALASGCGDGTTCKTIVADLGEICLPDTLAPDTEAVIDVRELCGSSCAQQPGCGAQLFNGQLVLDVHEEVCSGGFGSSCTLGSCQARIIRCRLPALVAGEYTVVAPGIAGRVLRVQPGGQSHCSLPTTQIP